jgi:hypothetical protein
MRLEGITIEDVRIHGEGQRELIRLRPVVNQYMRKQTPGTIANIRFKRVTLTGKPGEYLVQLSGADEQHTVNNVAFEKVSILGQPLTAKSENMKIGPHVEEVEFGTKGP